MSAVKYEDLTASPQDAITKIFKHCGLDTDHVTAGLTAMEQDSQRNCGFGREKLDKHMVPQMTSQVTEQMDVICYHLGLPRVAEECILEETLTTPSLT